MIYFDNAATTQLSDFVKAQMIKALDTFGNPSSLYDLGICGEELIRSARRSASDVLRCSPEEIIFTSGGTESDNTAIFGAVRAMKHSGKKIVTTAFEHSAVISPLRQLENDGYEVVYLQPDESGTVPLDRFEQAIDGDTVLVTVMHVNNETGAILPVDKLKSVIRAAGSSALLHCDATQSFCKYEIMPKKWGIDLLTASSHKIHGPKGVGILYCASNVHIKQLIYGGLQQKGFRPGTEPTVLIAGFDAAIRDFGNREENARCAGEVKRRLIERLKHLPDITVNSPEKSSDYILSISVNGIKSETLLHFLESKGIYVSSGSACSKGRLSHVVSALGYDRRRADSVIRLSFSKYSTVDEADALVNAVSEAQTRIIRAK